MLAATTIAEEILELKKSRKAILLAHHYQEPEIQELADVIGDSLELARKAREFEGEVIAFCGVWFMAETAKALNPNRTVVVPDRNAACSLVDGCPVEPVREFRRRNPGHVIVSYINTSIEVKAESDILCTSRNAVKVVNFQYTTGGGQHQHTSKQTVAVFPQVTRSLPDLQLAPENVFHKLGQVFGYQDIDFESNPDFSSRYLVRGPDETAIRAALYPETLSFFAEHEGWTVEIRSGTVGIYRAGQRSKPEDVRTFLEEAREVLRSLRRG